MIKKKVKMDLNRICAEISLDSLLYNLNSMKNNVGDSDFLCVLKTNAYGMGAVPIARELEKIPYVKGYCTATADEGLSLRKAGINKPILNLGISFEDSFDDMIRNGIRPAISSYEEAEAFSRHAEALSITAPIHIAVDTGMNRIGFRPDKNGEDAIKKINELPGIEIEGIFTHFARCDERDKSHAVKQEDLFKSFVNKLNDAGIIIKYAHSANSAAILEFPPAISSLVRAGVTLYGMWPSDEIDRSFPLKPVMSLKSHVSFVKNVPAGQAISYGGTFVTKRNSIIATIPVGYGDGYPRSLSNKGFVLIHGKKAPITGRVCMDQLMVDVTDIGSVKPMDEVTLIGRDGSEEITIEELGDLSGRFNYELSCLLGNRRVPKLYYKDGRLIDTVSEL